MSAQIYPVDTLIYNGPVDERINFVFVGDGYKDSEMGKFILDTESLTNELFSVSPFKEYKNYFNVFAVRVPSVESGATHLQQSTDPECLFFPIDSVDNFFGSRFDAFGTHRLLVAADLPALLDVIFTNTPYFSQICVVVNSPIYGGSGGNFCTSSTHDFAKEIYLHELGHSFGGLADEYWSGESYGETYNMTQVSDPKSIKWKNWLGFNGIGIYRYEESTAWYRPHQQCKMRQLGMPFCAVCVEGFVDVIQKLVGPVTSVEPPTGIIEPGDEDLVLRIKTLNPDPNTLKVTWKQGSKVIDKNVLSTTISKELISDGYLRIFKAEVMDTTALTRNQDHIISHLHVYEWKIDGVTAIEVENSHLEYNVDVWPNPYSKEVNVSFMLELPTNVSIRLLDVAGNEQRIYIKKRLQPGEHRYTLPLNDPGLKFLSFDFSGSNVTVKLIGK